MLRRRSHQAPHSIATANRRLEETLDRQRIVWLAGRHLPQKIVIAGDLGCPGHPPIGGL